MEVENDKVVLFRLERAKWHVSEKLLVFLVTFIYFSQASNFLNFCLEFREGEELSLLAHLIATWLVCGLTDYSASVAEKPMSGKQA